MHDGPVRSIRCRLDGEVVTVPILRRLLVSGPATDSRSARSWFEYDAANTTEERPHFTFRELQAALAASALPLPQFSGRWRLEEVGDWPGFSAYTLIAIPWPGATSVAAAAAGASPAAGRGRCVECLVVALQSNDEEEWKYETFLVGRGQVTEDGPGGESRIAATLHRRRLKFNLHSRPAELETLQGTPDRLRLSSGLELVRLGPEPQSAGAVWSKEEVEAPAAAVHALVRQLVPDALDFAQAVQAGDVARVGELLPSQDLDAPMPVDSRLGRRASPLVAAALRGRTEVVDLLLAEHSARGRAPDPWTLACAAACSPRAAAALLLQLEGRPELRQASCPRNHPLKDLGMDGCTLVEVAVLAGGKGLARELVARGGCEHSLETAVQSGDAAWLEANAARWAALVDRHFPDRGATVLAAGLTPLIVAAAARDLVVVQILLRHGADPFTKRRGQLSTAINYAQASRRTARPQRPTPLQRLGLATAPLPLSFGRPRLPPRCDIVLRQRSERSVRWQQTTRLGLGGIAGIR